jgi:hypothetical protein
MNDLADVFKVPVMVVVTMVMTMLVIMMVIVRISIKDNINFRSGYALPLVLCYFQLITRETQLAELVNQ